jgi:anti-sigma factor RsiW
MRRLKDESYISAYLDEMLSGRDMTEVKALLDNAPEARRQADHLEHARRVLRRLPDPDPPPDFWPRTFLRLRAFARLQARRSIFQRWLARLLGGSLLLLAVTIAGVLIARP